MTLILPLISEIWKTDGGVAFGVVPKSIWSKTYPSDEHNLVPMVNRLLLVKTESALVLIDAGFGFKRDDKYYRYKYISERTPLLDLISGAGFNPHDVTDVIFTHLHDDHVGGVVDRAGERDVMLFPEARHWVSAKQFHWAANPNPREAASYFPDNLNVVQKAGRLRLVDQPREIIPGIEVRLYDGHTAGQMIPLIKTPLGKVAYMADFIPSKSHIPLPYVASVDVQPLLTLKEKEQFLEEAVDNNYLLVYEHDAVNEACFVVRGEHRVVPGESLTIQDFLSGYLQNS